MAETERAYLKSRWFYVGVDPNNTATVYSDRPSRGPWEVVELTKLENGLYAARFVDADVMLSLQPNGTFETRPAGEVGDFEQMAGGVVQSGPQAGLRILGPFVVERV